MEKEKKVSLGIYADTSFWENKDYLKTINEYGLDDTVENREEKIKYLKESLTDKDGNFDILYFFSCLDDRISIDFDFACGLSLFDSINIDFFDYIAKDSDEKYCRYGNPNITKKSFQYITEILAKDEKFFVVTEKRWVNKNHIHIELTFMGNHLNVGYDYVLKNHFKE